MAILLSAEMRSMAYAHRRPDHAAQVKALFDLVMTFIELPDDREPAFPAGRFGGDHGVTLPTHFKGARSIVWRGDLPVGLELHRSYYCCTEYHWEALAQYFLMVLSKLHRQLAYTSPEPREASSEPRDASMEATARLTKSESSGASERASERALDWMFYPDLVVSG